MNRWYPTGLIGVLESTTSLQGDVRAALVTAGTVYNSTHTAMADLASSELLATNYVRAQTALEVGVLGNFVSVFLSAPAVWATLGGATNSNIGAVVFFLRTGSNDTLNPLLFWIDQTQGYPNFPLLSDGADFTLKAPLSAGGLIRAPY